MEYSFSFGKYKLKSDLLIRHPICSGNNCKFLYPCAESFPCDAYELKLSPGDYFFEIFGAQGGTIFGNGAFGGYSSAKVTIPSAVPMFLYLGGRGQKWNQVSFNGGGQGSENGFSGGGASDFRLTYNDPGSRFLIAGGGGAGESGCIGGGEFGFGGYYTTGGNQTHGGISDRGYDNTNGSFGSGGNGKYGGGGGLFGGGAANYDAGGGSGFVYSENKATNMIREIKEISISNGFLDAGKNPGHGYAVITRLSHTLTSQAVVAVCKCVATCLCQPFYFSHNNIPALFFNLLS